MRPEEILAAFEDHGVLQTGHFKLSSGRHSDSYLQKQRVFEDPGLTMRLAEAIVERFPAGSFDVVVSPAVGAILLGGLVAYAAGTRFVFTERAGGEMQLRRGQSLLPGERVLVVEDIVTTGGSAAEVVAAVERVGGAVVGVAVLADRSSGASAVPITALVRIEARDWGPDECPLCIAGLPLDAPGSKYLSSERPS